MGDISEMPPSEDVDVSSFISPIFESILREEDDSDDEGVRFDDAVLEHITEEQAKIVLDKLDALGRQICAENEAFFTANEDWESYDFAELKVYFRELTKLYNRNVMVLPRIGDHVARVYEQRYRRAEEMIVLQAEEKILQAQQEGAGWSRRPALQRKRRLPSWN